LIVVNFNTKSYSALSWIGIVVIMGLLIFVKFYGVVTNKARSWIDLGFFQFQPSELAKVVLIVWFAAFYEFKRKKLNDLFTNLFPIGIAGFISALIILQPDFGTAGVILILAFLLYLLIPIKRITKFKVASISVLLMSGLLVGYYLFNTSSFDRQISRLDFANPCSENKFYTTGNQVCNSYIAFNNGDLFNYGDAAIERAIKNKNYLLMTPEEAKLFTESGIDENGNLFGYKKGWPEFFKPSKQFPQEYIDFKNSLPDN
jgi:cell division protein FtsW